MRMTSPALDEERNVDGRAGLQPSGLGRVRGGVAAKAGVGLHDLQLDVRRQVDADRRAVVELHVHDHSVLQEVRGVADQVALKRDILERLLVHEVIAVGVVVEHLHLTVVHHCALEFLPRAKRPLQASCRS